MELIFPNEAYYESYREAAREYEEKGITNHLFLKDGARSICEQAEDSREGEESAAGVCESHLSLARGRRGIHRRGIGAAQPDGGASAVRRAYRLRRPVFQVESRNGDGAAFRGAPVCER